MAISIKTVDYPEWESEFDMDYYGEIQIDDFRELFACFCGHLSAADPNWAIRAL